MEGGEVGVMVIVVVELVVEVDDETSVNKSMIRSG
jgi:hypothetical protein